MNKLFRQFMIACKAQSVRIFRLGFVLPLLLMGSVNLPAMEEVLVDQRVAVSHQDSVRGVIALNPDKAMYKPGDTADIALAVLDDQGMMVCDADIELSITHQPTNTRRLLSTRDGTIKVHPECFVKAYTDKPDFSASIRLKEAGEYQIVMNTTVNGHVLKLTDEISVSNDIPFTIQRQGPTRIFPLANYPVLITVTATDDVEGVIEETVPGNFRIFNAPGSLNIEPNPTGQKTVTLYAVTDKDVQEDAAAGDRIPIRYPIKLKAGETQVVEYTFYAPSLSPDIFELGPITIKQQEQTIYQEARQWLVASDAPATLRPDGDGTTSSYTQSGETAAFWDSIDDDPDSADDDTSYVQSPAQTDDSMFVTLSDTPADFTTTDTIEIKGRHRETGTGNDTCTVYYQVFQSNETTAITGETSGTLLGTSYSTNAYTVSDSGQNKTTWDAARLRIRNDYIKNQGPDDAPCRVTAVEVNLTYTPAAGFTIGGTSDLGSGTVFLAYNGTLQSGDTGTISGGVWTITPASAPNSGDVVTVWVDNVTDANETTAVTKYDGSGNITGLVLDANVLSIGSVDNQSLTVTNLGQYDADQDEDIMHSANSGTVLVQASGNTYTDETIDILANNTLTIGGTETLNTHNLTINGTLTSSGAGTFTVSGGWDNNNNFESATETITFTSTGSETIDSTLASDVDVNNVTFNGVGGTWTLESALDVNGDFTITNGTVDTKSGEDNSITVGGNWDNNATFTARSGLVTFDGSAAQTVSAGSSNFNDVTVTNGSASGLTFDEAFTVVDFTNTTAGATMKFQQSTTFTVCGSLVIEGAAGNEVTVDSVNGSTRFTFDVTGSNQATREVTVSNANASSNDIKVFNGTNGGNVDYLEASPRWVFKREDCLVPDGDGTTNSYTQFGETAAFWDSIDDDPDANDGDTSYVQSAVQSDGSMFVTLSNTSVDFSTADNVLITAVHRESGAGNDTCTAYYQVYQSNETTTITSETGGTLLPQQAAFQLDAYSLGSAASSKSVWDAARLRIRNDYNKNGPSDDAPCRVSAVEVCVEYTSSDIDISGTCQQADQSTNCTDTGTVRVAVNGNLQAQTQPTVGGTWSILGVTAPVAGDVITVFIDAAADNREAVAVTVYDGSGNITGLQLFEEKLTIGSDDTPTTVTNLNLSQYDNSVSGDEDVFHEVDGANDLTVDTTGALTQEELIIKSGWTFRPDSGSSGNVNTHDLENNGTITADGNTFTLNGNWFNAAAATFTANSSQVTFNGTTDQSVTSNGDAFNSVTLNNTGAAGSDDIILTDNLDINGNLTITDGDLDSNTNNVNLTVAGNWSMGASGSFDQGTSTVSFDGAADQTITSNAIPFYNVVLNNTGAAGNDDIILADALDVNGTITITDGDLDANTNDANITVAGNWSMGALGSLDEGPGTETVTFDGASTDQLITTNGEAFNNVILNNTAAAGLDDIIIIDTLVVNGDLTVTDGDLDFNTNDISMSLQGNWTMGAAGSFDEGTSTVTFNGGTDQTVTSNGEPFYNMVINNTAAPGSNNIILADALDVNGTMTISDGDLDPNTNNVNITVAGNWTVGALGTFDEGTETVTFDGANDQSITSNARPFYNLILNNTGVAGSDDITLIDALDVNGNLTITDGDLDPNTNNININLAGNWVMGASGSLDEGAGTETVIFDSTTSDQTITSNAEAFNNITLNNTAAVGSDDITIIDSLDVNGDMTITDGDLDVNTNNIDITVAGNWTTGVLGSFDRGTQTVTFDGTTDQTITSNGGSFANVVLNNTGAAGSDDIILSDLMDMQGNLTITDGDLDPNTNNANISLTGNWVMGASGSLDEGTETVVFTGTTDQTITSNGEPFYSVTLLNTGALGNNDIILVDTLDVNGNLTITDGNLDANTNGIDITVAVNWNMGINGLFTHGTQTVTFDGTTDQDIISNAEPFYNVILNNTGAAGSDDIVPLDALDVNGTITLTDGDLDPNVSNENITVAGNWIMGALGSLDEGTGTETVTFDGATDQSITSDGEPFNNVTFNNTGVAGNDDIILVDALDINGDIVITDGDLDPNTNNLNINVAGNWNMGAAGSLDEGAGTETVIFDGSAVDQSVTTNGEAFNNFTVNNTAAAGNDDIIIVDSLDINGDVTLTDGDLDVNTNNVDVTVAGNWTFGAGGTLDAGTQTVTFDSTAADQTITSNGQSFYSVTLNNTAAAGNDDIILTGTLDVNGNLTITDGDLDPNVNDANITLAGNWVMGASGSLEEGTGTETVIFDGTAADQSVTTNGEAFNNFTVNNTAAAGNDDIIIVDSLDVNGDVTLTDGDLDVNTNNIDMTVAGNWTFGASGTLDAGTQTVTFDSTATDQTITSNGQSFYSVTLNNTAAAGNDDIILTGTLDVNGDLTITEGDLDPNANNVNITLAGNWIMGAAGSLDEGAGTETVIFDGTAADQSVTTNAQAFNNFTVNNTAAAGNDDIIIVDSLDVNGDVTLTDGDLDINTNNIDVTVAGNWTFGASGTLDAGTQTVTFDSTAVDQTITSNGQSFYNVTLNNTAAAGNDDIIISGTLDVNGSLSIADGDLDINTNDMNITLAGNWVMGVLGSLDEGPNSETVIFDGTAADQTITSNGEPFNHVNINNTAIAGSDDIILVDTLDINGNFTITDGDLDINTNNIDITVAGNWTMGASGSLDEGTQTVTLDGGANQTVTSNSEPFYNLIISNIGVPGTDNVVLADNLDVNGTLIIADGDLDPNTNNTNINIGGNWIMQVLGSLDEGAGTETVIFDSTTADQSITSDGEPFNNVTFNNTGVAGNDDIILVDAVDINGDIVITDGDLDPNTNNLNINIAGNWTMGAAGSLDEGTGTETVIFDGTAADQSVTTNGEAFNNFTINNTAAAGNDDIIIVDSLDVNGDVTLTDGDLDVNTNNIDMTVAGNWTFGASGTLDAGTQTVTFDSTATDQTITSNGQSFYSVTLNNTAAAGNDDIILTGTLDVNGNLTITDGDLDPNTNNTDITLAGNWVMGASGSLDEGVGAETIIFDGTAADQSVTTNGEAFNNFTINNTAAAGNDDIIIVDSLDVNGDVTLTDGDLDINTNNIDVTVAGNWTFGASGSLDAGTQTVTFDSTAVDQTITSNGQSFYSVTLNNTAAAGNDDIILTGTLDVNGDLTITDGNLDQATNNANITLAGNWTTAATGSIMTGIQSVFFDQSSGIQTLTGSLSFYNFIVDDPNGGGDLTVVPTGTLDINGTFLLTDGNFDLATNNPAMFVEGNFTLQSGSFTPGLSTITFDGDKLFTDNIVTNVGTLVIDPTTTLSSDLSCSSLTVNANDTLVTDGYEINCSSNITINGTLDARPGTDGNTTIFGGRNWDSGSGLLMMANSTVVMDDTAGNNSFTSGSNTFYNLYFDDGNGGGNVTWNLQDDLDVEGTLQIVEGVLDVTTSNHDIFVAGNWYNSDTFTERSATVVFDGTSAQTITTCDACTSGDFNNIIVSNGSGSTVAFFDAFTTANFTATTANTVLTFEASTTVTITNTLNLNGQSNATRIILDSSDGATRFEFDVTGGDQTVSFINVSNSESSTNDIKGLSSVDGGNTDAKEASPHWILGPLKGAVIIVD